MTQRLAILFLLLASHLILNAQVHISGVVDHRGDGLDAVTIKVVQDAGVIKTLGSNRRGRYETTLPFNQRYTLMLFRPFMLPVVIDVDTRMPGGMSPDVIYEVPLNLTMYYRYEGMDEALSGKSIGVIQRTGEGEETFSFLPDAKVIERLKPLHAESTRREDLGEDPVASNVFTSEKSATKREEVEDSRDVEVTEDIVGSGDDVLPGSAPDREVREAERYEVIETSKSIASESARKAQTRESYTQEQSSGEVQAYVEDSKRERAAMEEEDRQREAEWADARVQKNEKYAKRDTTLNVRVATTARLRLVKHSVDVGYFSYVERVEVEKSGKRYHYKKSVYNWLLFDMTYYTKDEVEISQQEYEQIKRLVDI